jgi:DNA-binding response OmpR family regulator
VRVLVVEDEVAMARAVKRGLEREGYAVDTEADGRQAATRIQLNHADYDLIILDVALPGINGVDLCRATRRAGISVPILMLTARDSTQDKVRGLDSGADDYLVKPFDFDELLARMRTILRRPEAALPPVLKVGDLVLDPVARTVERVGRPITLTAKEFVLLEFLMRNAGQVLTREQLLGHLWDEEFDSFSNVVDVHIKNLRKKIGDGDGRRLLETVRGVGYRLLG